MRSRGGNKMFLWELNVEDLVEDLQDNHLSTIHLMKIQKNYYIRKSLYIVYHFYAKEAKEIVSNLKAENYIRYKKELLSIDSKLSTILFYLLYKGEASDFNQIYEEIQFSSEAYYQAICQRKSDEDLLFTNWLLTQPEQSQLLYHLVGK